MWPPGLSCCGPLVAVVGGRFACFGGVARWWCSLLRPVGACRILWWGGWLLVPPGRGSPGSRPHSCFVSGVYRWCRLRGSAPLPVAPAVSAGPWLVVCPLPSRGPVPACLGWSFVWPGGGSVAAVVRPRWLRPVTGLDGLVSRFPRRGLCGFCPWSRLAGGLSSLVGCSFALAGLWLSLLLPPASLGWWVCPSGVGRAPPMARSGSFLLFCGWGTPPLPFF